VGVSLKKQCGRWAGALSALCRMMGNSYETL
jgi:hypothetical protein